MGGMAGCFNLGDSYNNARGVKQDYVKAKELFVKACDGGVQSACFNIQGVSELTGKIDAIAVEHYERLCEDGVAKACLSAGTIYLFEDEALKRGIEQDYDKAFKFFNKSCNELNYTKACYNLGMMYKRGESVDRSVAEALKLFSRSCWGGQLRGCLQWIVRWR